MNELNTFHASFTLEKYGQSHRVKHHDKMAHWPCHYHYIYTKHNCPQLPKLCNKETSLRGKLSIREKDGRSCHVTHFGTIRVNTSITKRIRIQRWATN